MIYSEFQGKQLSLLGFGAMRLPMANNEIDVALVEKMVAEAGAHKVLFATDAPMYGYRFIQGAVLAADITDAQKKMILRDNAARLLGLEK